MERAGAIALLLLSIACSETVNIGDPLPPPSGSGGEQPNPVLSGPETVDPDPAGTYAWEWVSPVGSGVHFRGVWTLRPGENWIVGDNGTVLREVDGAVVTMRTGIHGEQLSAVWARSASDVWVGGARGAEGLLLHWDGERWTEIYSAEVTRAPVRAIHGLAESDIFLIVGGRGLRMNRESLLVSHVVVRYLLLEGARDVWVEREGEIWFVGDEGVIHCFNDACSRVSDAPSFGVWGDGNRLFVGQNHRIMRYEHDSKAWSHITWLSEEPQVPAVTPDAWGKPLVGDASGRLAILLRPKNHLMDGYAIYDPARPQPWTMHRQTVGTRVNALFGGPNSIAFVGDRGLRGEFIGDAAVTHGTSYRGHIFYALPAPDGGLFALGSPGPYRTGGFPYTTEPLRWSDDAGWVPLPSAGEYSARGAVAASKDRLWFSGWRRNASQPPPTLNYDLLEWTGSAWRRGPGGMPDRFTPLASFGPNDVWGVSGECWNYGRDCEVFHYDGHGWNKRDSGAPNLGGASAINGLRSDDVWILDPIVGLSHWDGSSQRFVAPFPHGFRPSTQPHAMIEAGDGSVWVGGVLSNRHAALLHFRGNEWHVVELAGLDLQALSRGPDGKVRLLAGDRLIATEPGGPWDYEADIFVVDDNAIQKELGLPPGHQLIDLVSAGPYVYAVGRSGATLRLKKIEPPGSTR